MAINVADNFSYKGGKPLDARIKYDTITAMVNTPTADLYDGCFAYVTAEKKNYQYDSSNAVDPTLGKWREFEGGGGGGHTIEDADGTTLAQRDTLKFGEEFAVSDDSTNEKTIVNLDPMPEADIDDILDGFTPTGNAVSVRAFTPIGTILPLISETAPKFFLKCDGATYNKADYPELASHLLSLTSHSQYEVSGDATKFKVPDLRGEFLRGTGTNSHTNQGNGDSVGVHQDATVIPWCGTAANGNGINFRKKDTTNANLPTNMDSQINLTKGLSGSDATYNATGSASSLGERYTSRPTNTSVLYCIAVKDIYTNPINDYSTSEKVVGTWINGKPLYQKTVDCGALPNATSKNVAHGISNLSYVTSLEGTAVRTTGTFATHSMNMTDGTLRINTKIVGDNVVVATASDLSSFTGMVTIQYCKSTD